MKLQQIFRDLSQADIHTIEQSPGLLIFLPMLYIAWSDSVLSDEEITSIEQKIQKQGQIACQASPFAICQLGKLLGSQLPRLVKLLSSPLVKAFHHLPMTSSSLPKTKQNTVKRSPPITTTPTQNSWSKIKCPSLSILTKESLWKKSTVTQS